MFILVEDEEETDEEVEEEQEIEEEVEYVEDFEESDAEDMEDMTGDVSDEEEEIIKALPSSKKRSLEIEYEPSVTKSKERLKHRRQTSSNGTHAWNTLIVFFVLC